MYMTQIKTFNEYFNYDNLNEENKFVQERKRLSDFLKDKPFINNNMDKFLYHGTKINPKDFKLEDDWEEDSGNIYEADVPEGYLYTTDDMREANAYGYYIIPCEFKYNDTLTLKVNSDAPSRVFDDDFSGYSTLGLWSKFMDSGKSVLEIKGHGKSTFITNDSNIIPRIDLAEEFYKTEPKYPSL